MWPTSWAERYARRSQHERLLAPDPDRRRQAGEIRRVGGRQASAASGGRRLRHIRDGRAPAVRVDPRHAVQDLARARIDLDVSDRPGPLGAVDPLDAGVARVQERRAFGEVLDHEGVPEARLLEGVVPPERCLPDRRALGLGNPAVEVVDDRLDGLGERRLRVLLLEPPADGEVLLDRLGERRRVIEVPARDETDARIEGSGRDSPAPAASGTCGGRARLIVWPSGSTPARPAAGSPRRRSCITSISVFFGKAPVRVEAKGRARDVLLPVAELRLLQGRDDVGVGQEERRRVDEHAVAVLRRDRQRGEHRRRKGLLDDARALRVGDAAAVRRLPLDAGAPAARRARTGTTPRSPICPRSSETSSRPAPPGEARAVEKLLVPPGDLQQKLPLASRPSRTGRKPSRARVLACARRSSRTAGSAVEPHEDASRRRAARPTARTRARASLGAHPSTSSGGVRRAILTRHLARPAETAARAPCVLRGMTSARLPIPNAGAVLSVNVAFHSLRSRGREVDRESSRSRSRARRADALDPRRRRPGRQALPRRTGPGRLRCTPPSTIRTSERSGRRSRPASSAKTSRRRGSTNRRCASATSFASEPPVVQITKPRRPASRWGSRLAPRPS